MLVYLVGLRVWISNENGLYGYNLYTLTRTEVRLWLEAVAVCILRPNTALLKAPCAWSQ